MVTDDSCSFCGNAQETLEHIFIRCPFTQILWNDVELYLSQKHNRTFTLTTLNKLFGILEENSGINHILTLTRKHIYFCKQREIKPNIQDLQRYINEIIRLEKYSAKISQTSEKFTNKWKYFISYSVSNDN